MLAVRHEGLAALHRNHIRLLRTWRAAVVDGQHVKADEMLPSLLLTANAIAGGLRTTG